jgi:hypothetical protein
MEAMQLALGLTIPFLLTDHVLGARVSLSLFGTENGYAEVLLKFWFVTRPRASCKRSSCLSSGFTAALASTCGSA